MKLEKLYKKVVETGINNDLRGKNEVKKRLKEEKKRFDKLEKDDLEFYDKDRLFNPYPDTRILNGDKSLEIGKVIVGIDMQVGEILLTHLLNKDKKEKIDLLIS
ncbi:MAG: NGG1p interacting factor NIF3, partial [Candidatus Aminicenantes bacterium]